LAPVAAAEGAGARFSRSESDAGGWSPEAMRSVGLASAAARASSAAATTGSTAGAVAMASSMTICVAMVAG